MKRGEEMQENHVVTCFLEFQAKILLLKRSSRVGSYQGRWAGISGYLEPGVSPQNQACQEINEETGLNQDEYQLTKEGDSLTVIDENLHQTWIIHPFRFTVLKPENIHIDWEHSEYRWVDPQEILSFETVPSLYAAWERVQ